MSNKQQTDFGFKRVNWDEKASLVHEVFSSVAGKYDLMNDLMSGGLHRLWKQHMVSLLQPSEGAELLDLAGGTGDIAFRFMDQAKKQHIKVSAVITDINEAMLEEGRKRAVDSNHIEGLDWQVVNAEEIPFDDNRFDYVSMAFGIRNVTDRPKALKEIYRVLKPKGKFVCMEFSQVDEPTLAMIYDAYSFHVIPKLGELVAGDRDSYQYLVESIREFPDKQAFKGMIEEAGFKQVRYTTLTKGAVAIHSGWKL